MRFITLWLLVALSSPVSMVALTLDPIHTSTVARFGPVWHDKISNVNIPLIKPNQTLPN